VKDIFDDHAKPPASPDGLELETISEEFTNSKAAILVAPSEDVTI
jgi:hypothetical protein